MRVRIGRIDEADLNLFEFDYDNTMMIFFLNAEEKIYGRFGGRDAKSAEGRMSLAGLHYAMAGALETHANQEKNAEAEPARREPKRIRDVGVGGRFGRGGCVHCHQVHEILNADLQRKGLWSKDNVWRYPPPDNLGFILEINRGNVVKQVEPDSPAARAGLQPGDVVQRLNNTLVHSFADAQYALDRAPKAGTVEVVWQRGEQTMKGELALVEGWRRTDITWRPSLQRFIPSPRLFGPDLTEQEKSALSLSAKQLAFRQGENVHSQARDAGIKPGDIILGVDDRKLEMDSTEFIWYVRRNYVVGDRVTVNLIRNGERMNLPMNLR